MNSIRRLSFDLSEYKPPVWEHMSRGNFIKFVEAALATIGKELESEFRFGDHMRTSKLGMILADVTAAVHQLHWFLDTLRDIVKDHLITDLKIGTLATH